MSLSLFVNLKLCSTGAVPLPVFRGHSLSSSPCGSDMESPLRSNDSPGNSYKRGILIIDSNRSLFASAIVLTGEEVMARLCGSPRGVVGGVAFGTAPIGTGSGAGGRGGNFDLCLGGGWFWRCCWWCW